MAEVRKIARVTRWYRKYHRTIAMVSLLFFVSTAVTGLLLGWKKNTNGYILPKSYKGTSTNPKDWVSIDSLHSTAIRILHDSIDPNLGTSLQRIDMRPNKGMVKFIFNDHFHEVQLDLATAELLALQYRRSDIIENIHDGSILDFAFDTSGEKFKLVYNTIMGSALLFLTFSGFWLWMNPKRIRRERRR